MPDSPRGHAEGASFRDPAGHIYALDGRILRTVHSDAAQNYQAFRSSDLFDRWIEDGKMVDTWDVPPDTLGDLGPAAAHLLEHRPLPFISYPYEWSFPLLKSAALFHLDLQLESLEAGFSISDASAYNVQFIGPNPIFIDVLSFRPYREGEFWLGHRQFCEQFLNPLLLRAKLGIAHNAWYRGTLEGIPTGELAKLLGLRHRLSWVIMTHVILQARLQRAAESGRAQSGKAVASRQLSRNGLRGIFDQLRGYIARLEPAVGGRTPWGDYEETHSYETGEEQAKRDFVGRFVSAVKPATLWDLGCNTGAFSQLALESGAERVIGFDFDQIALQRAYARALKEKLDFLPLFLDACNPSPDQGWRHQERKSLGSRAKADALVALAFEHHLAIARNVPLDQAVGWLVSLAPTGVIEFVQKSDPTVQQMLALREDIFADYCEEHFAAALATHAAIKETATVSAHGRKLFWYVRS